MHNMESASSETIQSSSIIVSLETRIKDFRTASKSITKGDYIEHNDNNFNAWFSVSVSPNGFNKDTEGWLAVIPYVTVLRGKYSPQNSVMSWTVSVIDTEGNTRFPRSFIQDLSKDISDAKYLERSFILNRADDLLSEDMLTVCCDICFQWYYTPPALPPENHKKIAEGIIPDISRCDRKIVEYEPETTDSRCDRKLVEYNPETGDSWCDRKLVEYSPETGDSECDRKIVEYSPETGDSKSDRKIIEYSSETRYSRCDRKIVEYDPKTGDSRCDREIDKNDPETEDSIDDFRDFVEKNKILTEVLYLAKSGKVSAIYNPPSPKGRHPKVWIFSTRTENFNVILDDRLNSIGTRLFNASAVFRRCLNAPMKERREKRIELPGFDSQTFKNVVYFLTKETLPKLDFGELFEIYKFSHMYEMGLLQRNSAEDMVNSLDLESDFIALQKVADFYSDKYLSDLLCVCRYRDENFERDLSHFRMDDRPYSDSYI